MTEDETDERELMTLANEKGKFGIGIGYNLQERLQNALERLQEKDWIRLIDISPSSESKGHILRVFMLTKPALDWLKESGSHA